MSYTAKKIIRAVKKLGYQVKEGQKHTLVYHPVSGRHSTIPRGFIPKGTFKAILKQLGITEAGFRELL